MSRNGIRTLGTTLIVLALIASHSVAQEFRTWTDSTGKFKVEAKFVSSANGKVVLERENGSKITIELKKLSGNDQKVVADLEAANPFQPADDSPFQEDSSSGSRVVQVNWSDVRIVPLAPQSNDWSLAIGATEPQAERRPTAIPLPPKTDFFEGTKALYVNDAAGLAVVGYQITFGDSAPKTRVVVCSFAERGKVVAQEVLAEVWVPVALSSDGKTILMRRDEAAGGSQDRLELWTVAGKEIQRGTQWAPYDDLNAAERDVKWAEFVGSDRLLTMNSSGKVALWNLHDMQPEYSITVQGGTVPTVSPDGKYLVFLTGEDMGVLDVTAGEVLAMKAAPKTAFPVLRFSPSGKQLACAGFDKLFVFDMATGEQTREVLLSTTPSGGQLIWASENHVLLGSHFLLDIENQVPLWEYQGHEFVASDHGPCSFVVSEGEGKPGALITAALPQAGVEDTLKKAMQDEDFFVLKPGTTVRVNVDALPDPQEREKARTSLTQKLEELGMNVAANGTLELVAYTEQGQPREITYSTFGFGFGGDKTYTVREHFVRLKFMYNGKAAWETAAGGAPGFIHLQEGETVEQVLKKHEQPQYAFFQHVQLPKLLIKPTGRATLGSSKVSVVGIR